MTENQIAREIVDGAYQIHVQFGPGLLSLKTALRESRTASRNRSL